MSKVKGEETDVGKGSGCETFSTSRGLRKVGKPIEELTEKSRLSGTTRVKSPSNSIRNTKTNRVLKTQSVETVGVW